MMKFYTFFFAKFFLPILIMAMCLLMPVGTYAQSKKEARKIRETAQRIKDNTDYYWGEGSGASPWEAKRMALADLQSHIFVEVKSSTNISISNRQTGNEAASQNQAGFDIETRTGGVLTNTQTFVLAEKPEWRVIQYVERKEVQAIFDKRKERINMYVGKARLGEDTGRLNDALRYYYWAFCLLKTMPLTEEVAVSDQYNQKHLALDYIPERIDDITRNLKLKGSLLDAGEVFIEATYKDCPVTRLDFSYGSEMVQMANGVAKLELSADMNTGRLPIDLEYSYEELSQRDSEDLYLMVKRMKGSNVFPSIHKTIAIENKKQQDVAQPVSVRLSDGADNASNREKMQAQLSALLTELNQAAASGLPPRLEQLAMTEQARTALENLWENASFQCVNTDYVQSCLADASGYEVRGIAITQKVGSSQRERLGELCINFSNDGTITSVHKTLGTDTYRDIFDKSRDTTDLHRKTEILNFVEKFRSYYDEKDIESLRQIFSDDALIITGRVITRKTYQSDRPVLKQDVVYRRQNKTQYLDNLARIFQNNRYIRLTFSDVKIYGHKSKPNWYGVSLRQNWRSSTYEDDGYLFLLWEFPEDGRGLPVIHIRTWQPEWVGNRRLSKNEVFNINNFLIP